MYLRLEFVEHVQNQRAVAPRCGRIPVMSRQRVWVQAGVGLVISGVFFVGVRDYVLWGSVLPGHSGNDRRRLRFRDDCLAQQGHLICVVVRCCRQFRLGTTN